jgi:hypothetical protein
MKLRKMVIMTGWLLLVLLIAAACNGRVRVPEGTKTVAALLKNPVYDTEINVYGEVSLLGELFCPCFVLSSGGKSIEVWYSLLTEEDGSPWPTVSVDGFQNGDVVIVTGELSMDVKNVIWAVVINKAR